MKRFVALILVFVLLMATFMQVANASIGHGSYKAYGSRTCAQCSTLATTKRGCSSTSAGYSASQACSKDTSCSFEYKLMKYCYQYAHTDGTVHDVHSGSNRHSERHVYGVHDIVVCSF